MICEQETQFSASGAHLRRRSLLKAASICVGWILPVGSALAFTSSGSDTSSDPSGATAPSSGRVQVNPEQFGGVGDGLSDDAPAFHAAVEHLVRHGGGDIVLQRGRSYRLASPVALASGIHVSGGGRILFSRGYAFTAVGGDPDPRRDFVTDIAITGVSFEADEPSPGFTATMALYAVNVRNLRFASNNCLKCGGVYLTHAVRHSGAYDLTRGSEDKDPAVLAGLSPVSTDDLNENFVFADNKVDNTRYGEKASAQAFRFEFCRRGIVERNICKYAAISGWGGSAILTEGGAPQFLRRCMDVQISDNEVSWANGAVYLINARNCRAARNRGHDLIDVGIDFEGSIDCIAEHNYIKNVGNYCYCVFYYSSGNRFSGNIGIQDGAARGINGRVGTERYGPSLGTTLFAIRGKGFSNQPASQDAILVGEQYQWLGATGSGRISGLDFSRISIDRSRIENVVFEAHRGAQTGAIQIAATTFVFSQNAEADSLIDLGTIHAFEGAEIHDLTIEIRAPQVAGCVGIRITAAATSRPIAYKLDGNQIREGRRGQLPIGIKIDSTAASVRQHSFDLSDNVAPSLVISPSVLSSAHLSLVRNHRIDGTPI
jgi:hypothetical protein